MAQMFKAAKPPSSALCEKVLVLGVSVETLMSTPHTESLVNDVTCCAAEVIAAFPKDSEDCTNIKESVFPGNLINLHTGKQPPTYECHSVMVGGLRMRVHCIKTWELATPNVVYESNPIMTLAHSKAPSLRVSQIKRRASAGTEMAIYAPIALCVVTQAKYFASFRALLEHFFEYIQEIALNSDLGPAVANTEFIRIVAFLLNDTYLPPKCTQLTIQFGYKSIDFPVDYINEPVHSESCVQTLLDLVEVDALLTLWQCLLVEKNVIVMGRHNNLIYDVLEGLKMLIFPLKWVLTYVPLLSKDPMELLAESKTLLAGVNTAVLGFTQVAVKPMEGAVYDIDTGQLYLYPKHFEGICPAELTALRTTIVGLKAYRHRFYEYANVESEETDKAEDSAPEAWKWRLFMTEDDSERSNYHILEAREAFLRPLSSNLRHYSLCFTAGDKRNMPSFDESAFTKRIFHCADAHCKSIDFWKAVVHTQSFNQLLDEHSTWDESNSVTFRALLDTMETSKCVDVMWHLWHNRSKHAVYGIVLEPQIAPKGLYIQVLRTLEGKQINPTDPKFNMFLTKGRDYLRELQVTMKRHAYFSERYRDCLIKVEGDIEERYVWYGGVGLLRHVALVYECMDFEDFRELNCSEELLRRLDDEGETAWQALVLKAYVQEALGLPSSLILGSYTAAYSLNGGWIPFHRFATILQALPPAELDQFESDKLESSVINIIARNVRSLTRAAALGKTRSACTSPEPLFRPDVSSLRKVQNRDGFGHVVLRKFRKFGTAMGVISETKGGIEIRTLPLNSRFSFPGQAREGCAVATDLLITLKKLLAKHRNKIELGKSSKIMRYLESDMEFQKLQETIGELQVVNLNLTSQQNLHETLCFYLNLHNFIVLYAVLVKQETPNSAIEWHKLLSSVCFIVGEERMTPILIQKMLLNAHFNSQAHELALYTATEQGIDHPLLRYALVSVPPVHLAHFGLYLPATFTAGLRVYTPKAVDTQLEEQAKSCCAHTVVDLARREVTLPAIFHIKDFGSDEQVLHLIKKALKGLESRSVLKQLLSSMDYKVRARKSVEDWRFSLRKVLSDEGLKRPG